MYNRLGLTMLKKLFALVLLILALSPFNAPFQTSGGSEQQIGCVEQLSAIRNNSHSRDVLAQPFAHSDGAAVVSTLQPASILTSNESPGLLRADHRWTLCGDYSPRIAILRL